MAEATTSPVPPRLTPVTHTTRRGIAASSFCLSLWGTLTYWWYPFGIMTASLGVLLALICIVMGWRGGKDGTHLALYSLLLGGYGISLAIFAYRFVQFAFDGVLPPPLPLPL